jgi:hypothetical protein
MIRLSEYGTQPIYHKRVNKENELVNEYESEEEDGVASELSSTLIFAFIL